MNIKTYHLFIGGKAEIVPLHFILELEGLKD